MTILRSPVRQQARRVPQAPRKARERNHRVIAGNVRRRLDFNVPHDNIRIHSHPLLQPVNLFP